MEEIGKEMRLHGVIVNLRLSVLTTKNDKLFEKITFDIGNVRNIGIAQWNSGYEDIKNIFERFDEYCNKGGKEYFVDISYKYSGTFRSVSGVYMILMVTKDVEQVEINSDMMTIFSPIIPRQWQSQCFLPWLNIGVGIVKVGTGGGKTFFGIMAIKYLLKILPESKILISVPTIELQRQWKGELIKFGIDENIIGLVGGDGDGNGFNKTITIGIVNSLRNRELKADLFIGDEAHHLSAEAEQNYTIWSQNKFERMIMFSATPGRIGKLLPIICSISQDKLQEEGSLCRYDVYNFPVVLDDDDYRKYNVLSLNAKSHGWSKNLGKMYYGERFRFIANHHKKMLKTIQIVSNLQYGKGADGKVIIFFTTTEAVDQFCDMLKSTDCCGGGISKIHSKMKKKERELNFNRFVSGESCILVGAFAISEGINIPDASNAIIVGGTSGEREFIQRIGRVLRAIDGKDYAQIFQIYVKGTMEEWWIRNRKTWVAKSCKIREMT